MLTTHEQLILLNLVPGIGSMRLARLRAAFGSLDRLWEASAAELQQVRGIGPVLARQLVEARGNEQLLHHELRRADQAGVRIVTLDNPDYPAALLAIPDPPLALYMKGALRAADARAVAVVGTRHPSLYGLQVAEQFGAQLAEAGVTVVSGMARGIDGAAHTGALGAEGRTLAVLGCGLAQIYPPEHDALAERIVERGALLSEYPMTAEPRAEHFPRRNRIVSGLSRGVVVVEAGPRSGSLITVDCALEQGKEVFAVPGPISSTASQGAHALLKQGATLVTSVHDILDELFEEPPASRDAHACSSQESAVRQALARREARHVDELAEDTRLTVAELSEVLLKMELKGDVHQRPGQWYHLAGQA